MGNCWSICCGKFGKPYRISIYFYSDIYRCYCFVSFLAPTSMEECLKRYKKVCLLYPSVSVGTRILLAYFPKEVCKNKKTLLPYNQSVVSEGKKHTTPQALILSWGVFFVLIHHVLYRVSPTAHKHLKQHLLVRPENEPFVKSGTDDSGIENHHFGGSSPPRYSGCVWRNWSHWRIKAVHRTGASLPTYPKRKNRYYHGQSQSRVVFSRTFCGREKRFFTSRTYRPALRSERAEWMIW